MLSSKHKKRRDAASTLNRQNRKETERFKRFTYEEFIARDHQAEGDITTRAQANLDILWLKDVPSESDTQSTL